MENPVIVTLAGKTAIVTGAALGIGLAVTLKYLDADASGVMAIEYAPYGIRVNAIACGTVDTPIVHRSAAASGDPDRYWAMLRDNHPIGRVASPKEVASFFTYMASDLASFFTGSILMMDGGFTAR
jgi:NAD(P)-dependent dehydrogenase (short-subunit alcohol dehydrogenase family)